MEIARKCKRDLIFGKCLCTSCSKRKDRNPFFNKHFSEEQKKILSQKRKAFYNDEQLGNSRRKEQSIKHLGKNNPMYKGIEQRSNYYTRNKTVRKKIIQRDNNLCQCCKNYFDNKNLQVHYKNSANKFVEERLALDNCVTLCKRCHKHFHHKYRYGNNTAEQFYELLQMRSETIENITNNSE